MTLSLNVRDQTRLRKTLKGICAEHDYLGCVAALSTGEEVAKEGDFSSLRWRGFANSLFGDRDSIIQLNDSLEGRLLPQVYGQGEVFCVVMKPLDDLLVGAFGQGRRDFVRLYNEGTKISQRITNAGPQIPFSIGCLPASL